jgi:GNAT superfamily N-acetyltransferase
MHIRPLQSRELEIVKAFTVQAFIPIFESFANIMEADVFAVAYPDGVDGQRQVVQDLVDHKQYQHWVMDIEGQPVGYLVTDMDDNTQIGTIVYLVVDPNFHKQGIATALNTYAINLMKKAGMKIATVSTGGDISHQPARQAYEKVGFKPFPNVWYYQSLG